MGEERNQSELYLNRVLEIYEKILPTISSIHEDIVSLEQASHRSKESFSSCYNDLKEKVENIYRETLSFPISEIKEILEYVKVHNKEVFRDFTQSFKENKEDLKKIINDITLISTIHDLVNFLAKREEERAKDDKKIERLSKWIVAAVAMASVLIPALLTVFSRIKF